MKKINQVCIIEDDPLQVFITKKNLGITGMVDNTIVCQDGREAFEKLETMIKNGETLPDFILLDLNMPVWDGWQFLDAYSQLSLPKKIEIYILTSSANPEDIRRSAHYNLQSRYLEKPIHADKLKEIFEGWLEGDFEKSAG